MTNTLQSATQPSSESPYPHSTTHNPAQTYHIRLAQPADLPEIVEIYNQSIPAKASTADLTPVSIEDRQAWFDEHLNRPNRPIYVLINQASTTKQIMAWGSFSDVKSRSAYNISSEISIYVGNQYQGLGLGSFFLKWMMAEAPKLGIQNILALIFGHNQPSLTLFKKHGFEHWGTLPNVCDMQDFTADIVILGKALTINL